MFLQTAWNVGKDGIEAGTNLVPVSSLEYNLSNFYFQFNAWCSCASSIDLCYSAYMLILGARLLYRDQLQGFL